MKKPTTPAHSAAVLRHAIAIADGRASSGTGLRTKSPLNAFTLAIGGAMLSMATSQVDASWRIEQLRDDNGRSYYGWCNDETCPRATVLQAPQPPAPLPEPVASPPVSLNDALPLPGLSMREPTVFPRGPTPPMNSSEARKAAAAQGPARSRSATTGAKPSKAITRLPESKNGRPIPPSQRGRPSSLDEIEEARREAMRRSASRSPVPGKFLAPGAATDAPAGSPTQGLSPSSSGGKRQIILNPGVQGAIEGSTVVAAVPQLPQAQPITPTPVLETPVASQAPVALPAFQRLQPSVPGSQTGAPVGYLSNGQFFPASEVKNTGSISFEREVQPAKQLIGQTNKVTIVLNPGVR